MAKKKRRIKKIKIRRVWKINPRTRVKESSKRYRRTKVKSNFKKRIKREVV